MTAAQAGNTLYSAATSVPQSFVVNADQTTTFGSISSKATGFSPFTVAPSATSTLTVTLTSSTTAVRAMSTFTIAATAKTSRTITVAAASTSLTYQDTTVLSGTASRGDSGGAKTYSVHTGPGFCSIAGSTLTAISVGVAPSES